MKKSIENFDLIINDDSLYINLVTMNIYMRIDSF
jgi:hypothetical protein